VVTDYFMILSQHLPDSLTFGIHLYCPDLTCADFAVSSILTFVAGIFTGGHVGCYVGSLSQLFHKCVPTVWKRLTVLFQLCMLYIMD
jgi:hypothetical protein